MANENMDEFSPLPRVANETVRCVRNYLLKNKEIASTFCAKCAKPNDLSRIQNALERDEIGADIICGFPGNGWSRSRISAAPNEVQLMEEKSGRVIVPFTFSGHPENLTITPPKKEDIKGYFLVRYNWRKTLI